MITIKKYLNATGNMMQQSIVAIQLINLLPFNIAYAPKPWITT